MSFSIDELPATCQKAVGYANRVTIDIEPACVFVQSAVRRFFDDFKNEKFYLDWAAADRVMRFVEMMPHVKGPEAGKNIILEPWQAFIFLNIFGWKRKSDGFRRFRKVYTEVPRGNGKSTLVAPVALYMMAADGEGGAEVYSAATSRDQARIVFDAAKAMAQRRQVFLNKAGVFTHAHTISQDESNSVFKALSSDASTLDGLNVHFAVLDELARHKDRGVHDIIETATGKRNQPMVWMITTAGPDQSNIGFEVHDYAKSLLRGDVKDDGFFSIIYTIDEQDDWTDPAVWQKANPNWGKSVMPIAIENLANRALQVATFQNSFRMKHLNEWTNASVNWIDSAAWQRQASPVDEEELISAGADCIVAVDLASKSDVAAMVKMYRVPNDYEVSSGHPWKYYIFPTLYLPSGALKGRNASYENWAGAGFLKVTPGEAIDFQIIESDLIHEMKRSSAQELAYDPWQATQLAQRLSGQGVQVVEYQQTVRNFSEPSKEFEALVRQGLMFHNNNPVFNWMISNVVVKEDHKGNIYPRKAKVENKIDGPIAAIMALARWLFEEESATFDVSAIIG